MSEPISDQLEELIRFLRARQKVRPAESPFDAVRALVVVSQDLGASELRLALAVAINRLVVAERSDV